MLVMNKLTLFLLSIFTLVQSVGCFTHRTISNAKNNYPDEIISTIESAYIDANNNLYVNFKITPLKRAESALLYFKTNLDSVKHYSTEQNGNIRFFNKQHQKTLHMQSIQPGYYGRYPNNGIKILYTSGSYTKKSDVDFSGMKKIDASMFKIHANDGDYKGQMGHPSFAYFPAEEIKKGNQSYYFYLVVMPKLKKGKVAKHALIPLSLSADVVTAPIQLVYGLVKIVKISILGL